MLQVDLDDLKNPDPTIRLGAVEDLAGHVVTGKNPVKSVVALLDALEDKDARVRERAATFWEK